MSPALASSLVVRRSAVATALTDTSYDALLVTCWENVRYLSGFTGSNAALLVDRTGRGVLATDGRYLTQAAIEAPDVQCVDARGVATTLVARSAAEGMGQVGFEPHVVTVDQLGALKCVAGDVTLAPTSRMVEALRVVKDAEELAALATACEITDAAFADLIGMLRPGMTERDAAWALMDSMRRRGAEAPAFEIIAAFGDHSAIPHHRPTDRSLERGDLVKVDFGAKVDGYHADMTRTFVVGPPTEWQREIHAQVASLQATLRDSVVVGVVPADLDAAMRRQLAADGQQVAHGLGHGVGLAIHEDPFLTEASSAPPLVAGAVVTIEPGVYLPKRGGVRIEDTLAVTADGPVVMTSSPRELIEV